MHRILFIVAKDKADFNYKPIKKMFNEAFGREVGSEIVNPIHDKITKNDIKRFSHIIMPGSSCQFLSNGTKDWHKSLVEIIYNIEKYKKPFLGICFGMQFLAYSYGAKVVKLDNKSGYKTQKITRKIDNSRLFRILPNEFRSNFAHSDIVNDVPKSLKIIGSSNHALVCMIEHAKSPMFGIQFHPEFKQHHVVNFIKKLPINNKLKELWYKNIINHENDSISKLLPAFLEL